MWSSLDVWPTRPRLDVHPTWDSIDVRLPVRPTLDSIDVRLPARPTWDSIDVSLPARRRGTRSRSRLRCPLDVGLRSSVASATSVRL